jgi:thioredoxin-dependent peroxiredoxin
MDLLLVGSVAPPFQAKDQQDRLWTLAECKGRWAVLFFYPKDGTINCTKEACGFRDLQHEFDRENALIFGVSRDDAGSHGEFAQRRRLAYPLLVDRSGEMMRAYRANGWFGRARRVTYVVDPNGKIAWVYPKVSAASHASDVLAEIRRRNRESDRKARKETAMQG